MATSLDNVGRVTLSNIVVIAGDVELAEQVCSRLRRPGVYVPVIEAPIQRLMEYGFFQNDCIRVGNAVRAFKPKLVVFLKVQQEVSARLRESFSGIQNVSIESFDERLLSGHFILNRAAVGFRDLLLPSPSVWSSELFVVEGTLSTAHVIAANLAVAHGGRILQIPEVTDAELDLLRDEFRTWSNGSSSERQAAKEAILGFISARLPDGLRKFPSSNPVSFITRGIPYGILPFDRPTTHYFSFSLVGLNVCAGMLKSLDHVRCPVVILIDPNAVGQSEFETLRETFGVAGYHLRMAYGNRATIKDAKYLCQFLPSDFIFFSTHCGELDGRRIVERFPDRNGMQHEFCYDQAMSISPSPELSANPSPDGLVEVVFLYVPISMDGVSWSNDVEKAKINAGELLEDFLRHVRTNREDSEERVFLNSVESKKIRGFEALAMDDGNYLPIHESVGGGHYPVVFNNACSSWRTLSMNFGCCGASVYIGTSTDVLNPVATTIASSFVKAITSGKCVGTALFRSQKEFTIQFGYTPYLMHGYFYTKLNNPAVRRSHQRVIQSFRSAIDAASRLPEASKGRTSILSFLQQEMDGLSEMSKRFYS